MSYEEICKEYMQVKYTCKILEGRLCKEINNMFDDFLTHSNDGFVIFFDRSKQKIDGPMKDFRLLQKNGEPQISFSEFGDEMTYPLNHFSLGELKFIYEILYHKFYDVTN